MTPRILREQNLVIVEAVLSSDDETHNTRARMVDTAQADFSRGAVFQVFLFPALGGLLFGYDIGATSFVLTQLESSEYSGVHFSDAVEDSSYLQGAITSSGVGGALIGSILVFRVAEMLGRRVRARARARETPEKKPSHRAPPRARAFPSASFWSRACCTSSAR